MKLGDLLWSRLKQVGVDHVFGVPGDFCLGLLNRLLLSNVEYIGCCNELNAAYAADGYARVKGVGSFISTYAVGELSAINGVAGAYAENIPVIVVTGSPSTDNFDNQPLLHHTLGDYLIPFDLYKRITCAQTMIRDASTAVEEIDRCIRACLQFSLPVYIGICTDLIVTDVEVTEKFIPRPLFKSHPGALEEAILETLVALQHSRRPIFVPGAALVRSHLRDDFRRLVEKSGIPFASMMLGKSVIDEEHPLYIGLYCGQRSRAYVRNRVENSDCIVIFGERLTDFNTGGFSASLDNRSTIMVTQRWVRVSHHKYEDVNISDFVRGLADRVSSHASENMEVVPATQGCTHRRTQEFQVQPEEDLKMARFFDRISSYIKPDSVVIAETGASLFSCAEVMMPKNTTFVGQTFYGSIGYTVGATLGCCLAAQATNRSGEVYLFIGDGSFQVTCQDISTMIRYGQTPKIFLINNDGYTIERVIVDRSYNDIQRWKYHKLPEIFGGDGQNVECRTEGELEDALAASRSDQMSFIEIHLARFDCSESLRAAGMVMALNNRLLNEEEEEVARTSRAQSRATSFAA